MTEEKQMTPDEIMEKYKFLFPGGIVEMGDREIDKELFFLITEDLHRRVNPLYFTVCPLPAGQRTRVDISLAEPDYKISSRPGDGTLLTLKIEQGDSLLTKVIRDLDTGYGNLCGNVKDYGCTARTYKLREE